MTMPFGPPRGATDQESSEAPVQRRDELLDALRSEGPQREEALRQLHALLLRATRFEIGRRREAVARVRGEEIDDLANQAADDALVAVLGKLDDYRGQSRFTTWAYKFALLEAGVRLRRRAWQQHETLLAADAWPRLAGAAGPQGHAQRGELLAAVYRLIDGALTPHKEPRPRCVRRRG